MISEKLGHYALHRGPIFFKHNHLYSIFLLNFFENVQFSPLPRNIRITTLDGVRGFKRSLKKWRLVWRQTKSVHKETDVLNMNFQRFLRTIFEILKMTLKMKTEFSKMLFWKCDFSWKWKNANFVAKIGVYSRERREFAKNACLPLCDAFLQSPT